MAFTTKATINGWKNVLTQLQADGYTGDLKVKSLTVVNMTSTIAYLHVTQDGSANPATAANGLPFSTDTTASPSSTITLEGVDLASAWVNTGGSIAITFAVVGG